MEGQIQHWSLKVCGTIKGIIGGAAHGLVDVAKYICPHPIKPISLAKQALWLVVGGRDMIPFGCWFNPQQTPNRILAARPVGERRRRPLFDFFRFEFTGGHYGYRRARVGGKIHISPKMLKQIEEATTAQAA